MPRLPLIVASAVLCTAVLACGADDKDSGGNGSPSAGASVSTTSAEMTKDAYVTAVNAICKRVESEVDTIGEPKTAKDYEGALTKLIDVIDRAQADIKKLTPPSADASALQSNFIGPNDEQAARFKSALPSVQSAAAAGDDEAAEKAFGDSLADTDEARDKWMTDYGLTSCV